MFVNHFLCVALALALVGCASKKDRFKNKTAEELFASGNQLMKAKNYEDAADSFKCVETQFPYSARATESQVLSAYCSFMASQYMDATRELEIFLRYHSSHELVPYALYLKAMCLYMRTSSVEREQKAAQDARQAFIELINRFPNSKYHDDALKRVVMLDDILAAHEVEIGKFYQKRKNMVAAIGRYKFVIDTLPHTPHAVESYFRIIECCRHENLLDEARSTYEVLKAMFPDSKWTVLATELMTKK